MPDPTAPQAAAPAADPNAPPRASRRRFGLRVAPFDLRGTPWSTLGAVSAGGVLGALARYGLASAFPHRATAFPWATFAINVAGCLLIGILMVAVTEVWQAHRLARPFLGTGVLGGFTTFSTYIVDAQHAMTAGAPRTALAYLAGTLAAALAAVHTGVHLTRLLTRLTRPRSKERS